MSASFTPTGKPGDAGSSQAFTLENDGGTKTAVQVSMVHRKPDLDGKEELTEADEDFTLFPSQVVLQAREKKTVRVSWNGKDLPPSELAYRIVAEQLPVDGLEGDAAKKTPDRGGKIQVLLKFQGSVYVTPPGAEPKLAVEPPKSTEKGLEIVIRNEGTRHQILNHPRITFEAPGQKPLVLGENELAPLSGQNVLAGTRRRFILGPSAKASAMTATSTARIEVTD